MASSNGNGSRDKVRRRLLGERETVQNAISGGFVPTSELAEGWQEIDSPSECEIREIEYAHLDSLLQRLRAIEEALERINAGCYGRCSDCGRSIGARRLATDPAITVCLNCQQSRELQTTPVTV
jgi:RNA polymerase-binding transcription factor DksA